MNNEKKFIKLTPFKMQVLQTFPFIDADFDAITNYELLCKVVEYLNTTVDNVNLLESDFKVLYDYVHDYFDNLDVQREINKKLDEMAVDGTLQEIIASYLNSKAVFGFDNVESMKNSTNLINGSYAETLGYFEKNDGGSALYKIREIVNNDVIDNMFIIALSNNNLIAELIINNNTINFKQVGDNFDVFEKNNYDKIVFENGEYELNSTIILNRKLTIDFNNSIINYTGNGYMLDIKTHFNNKVIIKNGIFNGTTNNNFIIANDNTWGTSFDIKKSTINKFNIIFDCYQNFNNLFSELLVNSNGIIKFTGTNISNAIKFEKCYIKTYNADTDIYPDYKIILTNVRNIEFNNCCFEQCKTLFDNTSSNFINIISCEFEALSYIAKNKEGFNNLVGNVMVVNILGMFETDTIKTTPLTLLSSNRYFSTENSINNLRSELRNNTNLKEIYTKIYNSNISDNVDLYSLKDSEFKIYIPINILRNESTSPSNYLLTPVSSILRNQENESFIFTVFNYIIGNDNDYQIWKSEWIEINSSTFLQLSQNKLVDTSTVNTSLHNNNVTESMTIRNYQVTTSVNYKKVYTIIKYNSLGNAIFN